MCDQAVACQKHSHDSRAYVWLQSIGWTRHSSLLSNDFDTFQLYERDDEQSREGWVLSWSTCNSSWTFFRSTVSQKSVSQRYWLLPLWLYMCNICIPKEKITANMAVTILHVIHWLTHKPLASKDSEQVRGSFRFSTSFYTSFWPYDSRKYIIDRHQLMRPAIILRGVARPSDLTSLVGEELAFSATIVLSLLYVHERAGTVLYLFLSLRPTYDELIFDAGMPAIWNCWHVETFEVPLCR